MTGPVPENRPRAPGEDARPSAAAGLKSTLKVLVPLLALVGVVFGVTYVLQYKPPDEQADEGGREASAGEPPLRFWSATRMWRPGAESLQDQLFPGFFEPSGSGKAAFWFENRNREPVVLQLTAVNCSSCSGGSLAPIPPDATRDLLQMTALGVLPLGPAAGLPTGMAGPAANLVRRLEWQSHDFKTNDWTFTVPGAADPDGWSPQWGILDLNFNAGGKNQLTAEFMTRVQNTDRAQLQKFAILFEPAPPFEVIPGLIDLGEFTESTPARTYEFVVSSATRGPADLPAPKVDVRLPGGGGDPGALVSVGDPVLLPEPEREAFEEQRIRQAPRPVRVRAAYRVPVLVAPQSAGGERLDIGLLEREVWVAVPGIVGDPKQVKLRGVVTGGVWLSDAKEIDLGSFKSRDGVTKNFTVTTERADTELAVAGVLVQDQPRTGVIQVALKKLPPLGERGYYQITVTVPPGAHTGELIRCFVLLEVKGPRPQRVRIPVKGRAMFG